MSRTWELFALTHLQEGEKKSLHAKSIVYCPSGKWTMDCPLSTPKTTWKKKTPAPLTHKKRREATSLHNVTSHWLHRNCIPKIGCHYFWPRVTALLINLNFVNNFAYIGKFKLCLIWLFYFNFGLVPHLNCVILWSDPKTFENLYSVLTSCTKNAFTFAFSLGTFCLQISSHNF
jgi:hypothetical protein